MFFIMIPFHVPRAGFNLNPLFPPVMVGSPQGAGASSSPLQPQPHPLLDPNTTAKTEYMSFPPPVQRSPVNSSKDSRYGAGITNLLFSVASTAIMTS